GHQEAGAPVRMGLGPRQLIEIHRVGVVDARPEETPEVLKVLLSRGAGTLQRGDLRLGIGREVGEEAQLEHGSPGAVLQVERHGGHHPRGRHPCAATFRGRPAAVCAANDGSSAGSRGVARRRPGVQEGGEMPSSAFTSAAPIVRLTNGFVEAFDNAVATARTCYSPRIIKAEDVRKDNRAREVRDRTARATYQAGHHTTLQHATFQFSLENVSRQLIWSVLHAHPFYNSEQVSQRYVEVKPDRVIVPVLPEREAALYRG